MTPAPLSSTPSSISWTCSSRARRSASTAGVFDEFQIFDGRIAEPGGFDLNQHLVFGRRGRNGEGAPRNGLLTTSEIGYATATWHEIAMYLPFARERIIHLDR